MLWRSELEGLLPGLCRFNAPLAALTSWGVGGPAECLVTPTTTEVMPSLFRLARENDLALTFLGGGTNVLIPDEGLPGITVHTGRLDNVIPEEDLRKGEKLVVCGAGTPLKRLLHLSLDRGFTGLEFAAGIPGTLGGALIGNAGASGKGVGGLVDWVETIEPDGNIRTWHREDLDFSYRNSNLNHPGRLILRCCISLHPGSKDEIAQRIREHMARRSSQPHSIGTAGCVFKNPEPHFAGKLLEECGCKGLSCGSVVVSDDHANFFINRGQAKASDVWELILRCRKKVLGRTGIHLDLEVKLLGESWE